MSSLSVQYGYGMVWYGMVLSSISDLPSLLAVICTFRYIYIIENFQMVKSLDHVFVQTEKFPRKIFVIKVHVCQNCY